MHQRREKELIDLNHKIVERLNFVKQSKAHKQMLQFRIGEQVTFDSNEGDKVIGQLVKYNKKTVTVITHDGHRWNVSPSFLGKYDASIDNVGDKVIKLRKE